MENYFVVACTSISATALIFFTLIKACDWLISLKYKSILECSKTRHNWAECMKSDFASKESVSNIKEDMDEMKHKINDIHDVIMTFTVNNFKGQEK